LLEGEEKMSIHQEAPPDARPPLGAVGMVARLTLIGVAVAAVAGTFAYLGGWLTPNALTPRRVIDAFEEVNGVHPGFRRNHAKGVGVCGFSRATETAFGSRKRPSSNRAACRCSAASRWGAANPTRPTGRTPCAAWGSSSPCRTASCGEP